MEPNSGNDLTSCYLSGMQVPLCLGVANLAGVGAPQGIVQPERVCSTSGGQQLPSRC